MRVKLLVPYGDDIRAGEEVELATREATRLIEEGKAVPVRRRCSGIETATALMLLFLPGWGLCAAVRAWVAA